MPKRRKNSQCEVVLRSPMTCLPPEILSYIFRLYLDEQMPAFPPSAQSPSCLVQVCRFWRAIVESDSHLWTSIHFYFSDTRVRAEEDVRRTQATFDLHLKRSATLSLSLTYTDNRSYSKQNKKLIHLLVDRLREHSRRWKRISLHLPSHYISFLFTFTPCDLSYLEHLHISTDSRGPIHAPRLSLESATNLKSFACDGSYRSLIDSVDLHWGRLVEVSFDFVPWNQSMPSQQFSRLGDCQNIITFSLGIDGKYLLDVWRPITLPHLRTLRVRRLARHADTCLFDILILPQLETLEIDSRYFVAFNSPYKPWQDRIFSNLLANSGCALRHLSIQDVDFSNDELVRCLALSPTLTSLCFIPYPRSQDTRDVIRKLVVSPATTVVGNQTQIQEHKQTEAGTDPLVPELREIMLATESEGSLDPTMAMLRSRGGARARAAGVAALRRVEVIFFRKPRSPIWTIREAG